LNQDTLERRGAGVALSATAPLTATRPWSVRDYVKLTKPRISLLVTLTAAVGFAMGGRGAVHAWGLVNTMIGTLLVSGAANTLNQVLERTPDAKMRRTAGRPLPTGRVSPAAATTFATVLGVGGTLYCGLVLNWLTAAIAAATLASYAFVYTPLKRRTTLNTLVGAVPGALPPLGGWAAATGSLGSVGWALFGVVFLWQIPHFYSIAWLLRHEYAKAGFRMLPVVDPSGRKTAVQIVASGVALVALATAPYFLGACGAVYLIGSLALSVAYLAVGVWASGRLNSARARWLFVTSLAYLPALLVLMTFDKRPL